VGLGIQRRGPGASPQTGQQGPPQANATIGGPIRRRISTPTRHLQDGHRRRRRLHQRLEHRTTMSLLSTNFHLEIIKKSAHYLFFCLTLRETRLYLRLGSGLPRGLKGGNPPTLCNFHDTFQKVFHTRALTALFKKVDV
jgi:hypothetical protein